MSLLASIDLESVLPFIGIGFAAQLVDGSLGMAFGLISSTLLISMGVPPSAASAGVHIVESFTTAASGTSHIIHRNVDWRLFRRLVLPGIVGGALGAYVLTQVDAQVARPIVLCYLAVLAVYIIWRALKHVSFTGQARYVPPLGLAGGFLDAAGGGGWGPIVTSNLLVQGTTPRSVVGTVIVAEFFVTVTISAAFIATLGWEVFTSATAGLLIGGMAAAPLGALIAKRTPPRVLLVVIGLALCVICAFGIYKALI